MTMSCNLQAIAILQHTCVNIKKTNVSKWCNCKSSIKLFSSIWFLQAFTHNFTQDEESGPINVCTVTLSVRQVLYKRN